MSDTVKKPEKKELEGWEGSAHFDDKKIGYNQSCDEWEKYHEQEIEKLDKLSCSYMSLKDGVCIKQEAVNKICQENEELQAKLDEAQDSYKRSEERHMLCVKEKRKLQAKLDALPTEIGEDIKKEFSYNENFENEKYKNATINVMSKQREWIKQAIHKRIKGE